MPWDVNLIGLDHERAFNDNSLTLTLTVQQLDGSGQPVYWNPWFNPDTVRTDAGIPTPGERLTDVDSYSWAAKLGPTASWPSWKDAYRVRKVRWASVNNGIQLYRCTLLLTDRTMYCPGPFVLRSDGTSLRQVDRFRDENPSASTTDGTLLLGTSPIKGSGMKPERFEVTQVVINLTFPFRTDTSIGTYGWPNIADLFADKIRKVNSTAFLGLPIGSVMLTGIEVDPKEDEHVELTAQFVWDEWFHMNQEPVYQEGTNDVIEPVEIAGVQVPVVKWRSMSKGSEDFAAMFTADEAAWAVNGWRAFDTSCSGLMASTYATTNKEPLPTLRPAP
jgi:hypothetical protein